MFFPASIVCSETTLFQLSSLCKGVKPGRSYLVNVRHLSWGLLKMSLCVSVLK